MDLVIAEPGERRPRGPRGTAPPDQGSDPRELRSPGGRPDRPAGRTPLSPVPFARRVRRAGRPASNASRTTPERPRRWPARPPGWPARHAAPLQVASVTNHQLAEEHRPDATAPPRRSQRRAAPGRSCRCWRACRGTLRPGPRPEAGRRRPRRLRGPRGIGRVPVAPNQRRVYDEDVAASAPASDRPPGHTSAQGGGVATTHDAGHRDRRARHAGTGSRSPARAAVPGPAVGIFPGACRAWDYIIMPAYRMTIINLLEHPPGASSPHRAASWRRSFARAGTRWSTARRWWWSRQNLEPPAAATSPRGPGRPRPS